MNLKAIKLTAISFVALISLVAASRSLPAKAGVQNLDTASPTPTVRATRTTRPTATAKPTSTPRPTIAPKATKTPRPTIAGKATSTPGPTPGLTSTIVAISPAVTPIFAGTGRNITVSPEYYPCKDGQIKGNKNSKIYHTPKGASYAKTFRNVVCFDTEAEAKSAKFRSAEK
jgi:hypothetical protein